MKQSAWKRNAVLFLAVAVVLGGAWLLHDRLAPKTELRAESVQRAEQIAQEIQAEATVRTELVMEEIDVRLEEQGAPEYGPVYREIFLLYETAVVSMEMGAAYIPPEDMFLDIYAPLGTDDPLSDDIETAVKDQMSRLEAQYISVGKERAEQFRCILYPAIRAQLELERGLTLSDPLEQAVEEALDREMNEVVKPQLLLQGKLEHDDVFRGLIYDQVRHSVYKDHGVDLNEFS